MFRDEARCPDFANLQLILEKKPAPRPVMFDFIIGAEKEQFLAGSDYRTATEFERVVTTIKAFDSGGYDHAPIIVRGLTFTRQEGSANPAAVTKSLNEGTVITDRQSFNRYRWPELADCDFSMITRAGEYMHQDVKLIPFSLDGVLENTIGILGFENLCMLLYEDTQLVEDVFFNVGSRIYHYFVKCLEYDEVGAVLCNDDWGFNTHTMLSPDHLRKYVFPWYKLIVEKAHEQGKYAVLHSCGNYSRIIDDIIKDMKFDGRHSYEDKIIKVEEAYSELQGQIAVLGGIDVDYLARAQPDEIYKRSKNILAQSQYSGGYALGSGNSVPDYVPLQSYLAMLKAGCEDY